MIIDSIKNIHLYEGLSERLAVALKHLIETDFSDIEPGRYDIDGSDIYVVVQRYESKMYAEGKWEKHKKYIDIQYVADGMERIGYANIGGMKEIGEYNDEMDFMLFEGDGDFLTVPAGTFVIFFPQDVHMPCIMVDKPAWVKKVIIKVKL